MTVFEAYITNLGKYAVGQLVGETLKFPATTEEVQSLLKNIGVDGVRYEEFFITAFDGDVMGLYDYLTEYENLDELNHLAHLISELDSDEIETLEAALNKGDHTSSVADIINLVHNLDCYSLHPGVTDDETLGRIYVEDMELLDVPDNVLPYFDFEAYGRDMRINEGGHFAPTGYLTRSGDFKEVYLGIEDIPAEHRIFAYPKLNIREQMAAYKEVIDRSSLEGERLHPRKEHEPTPQELLDRMELFVHLWNALNSPPEVQGVRVEAHLILGKSYRQIAREQGVDKSAVRHSVKSGKAAMRKYLKKFL